MDFSICDLISISENIICKMFDDMLTIETVNGVDFLQGDDGYDRPRWNLYFSDDNKIIARSDALYPAAPQVEIFAVEVEGVLNQYLTQVYK